MGIKIGDNNKIKNSSFVDNKARDESINNWFWVLAIPLIVTIVGGIIVGLILG